MNGSGKFCAVVPFKGTAQAKQRLAPVLSSAQRQDARARDVAGCAANARGGPRACRHPAGHASILRPPRWRHNSARRSRPTHACDGHTGAVTGAAHRLAGERPRPADRAGRHSAGRAGRHPRASGRPTRRRRPSRSCRRTTRWAPTRSCARRPTRCRCASATTASSRISRPPERTASSREVVQLPRIALDIDTPEDLALFLATPSRTQRAGAARSLGSSRGRVLPSNPRRPPHEAARTPCWIAQSPASCCRAATRWRLPIAPISTR